MLKDITAEISAQRSESANKMLAPNGNHNKVLSASFRWTDKK